MKYSIWHPTVRTETAHLRMEIRTFAEHNYKYDMIYLYTASIGITEFNEYTTDITN
jgi:hypothetical protein